MHHQWLGLILPTALFRACSIRVAHGFATTQRLTSREDRSFETFARPRIANRQQGRIFQEMTSSSLFLFRTEPSPPHHIVLRRTGSVPLRQPSRALLDATATPLHSESSSTMAEDHRQNSHPRVEHNNDTYDHIVIGSGIGGLAVASLLAQSTDDSVLLLEQHTVLGGCTHTFARRGYSFGVGIHYVGEMGDDPKLAPDASGLQLKKLLDALTPQFDPVVWDRMPNNFDTVLLGNQESLKRYDMMANQQAQALKQIFLSEEDRTSIDVYFDLIRKASKSIKRAFLLKKAPPRLVRFLLRRTGFLRQFWDKGYGTYATSTVQEVLDSITTNPELQAVLSYSWGDYGCPPNEAPFVMHALLTAHYANGAYYPQGGPQQIARKIERVLRARQCHIKVQTPVRRIVVEDGRAVGVELLHDNRILRANKSVVSNAGYHNTLHRLLPPNYRPHASADQQSADAAKALKNGRGGLSLFIGLRGDHDLDWKLPHQNLWIYPDDVPMEEGPEAYPEQWQDMQPHRFAPVFVGAPSGKDSQWKFKHPGRSTLEILTAAPWEWFQEYAPAVPIKDDAGHEDPGGAPGSHGQAYDAAKEALAQVLWTRVRQGLLAVGASDHLPSNVQDADYYELGTPLTFAHYLWADRGAFYGLDHDTSRFEPEQFYLNLRSKVPGVEGLYLTGQDVASCGLAGAMCGGYLCASDILGVPNPYWMLQRVKKRRVGGTTTVKASRSGIKEKLSSFTKRRGLVRL